MTEAEWLACDEPMVMVRDLGLAACERKLRLFAVACCRRIWHLLSESEDRHAVELAERFADGDEGASAVENFRQRVDWTRPGAAKYTVYQSVAGAAGCVQSDVERLLVEEGASAAVKQALREEGETAEAARQAGMRAYREALIRVRRAERSTHCQLLRDIFGNPFRPVSTGLVWKTSTIFSLARQMYEARDFSVMPILADALEDAGCDNADLLAHCRGPGPHMRGCWVVDLVLGKQ